MTKSDKHMGLPRARDFKAGIHEQTTIHTIKDKNYKADRPFVVEYAGTLLRGSVFGRYRTLEQAQAVIDKRNRDYITPDGRRLHVSTRLRLRMPTP